MKNQVSIDISDAQIREILLANAPIENFYISQSDDEDTGMLYYCSEDGQLWTFLIERENVMRACIRYLKKHDVPAFHDISEMLRYGNELQERVIKAQKSESQE